MFLSFICLDILHRTKEGLLLNSHSKCSRVKNECQMLFYNYDVFKALLGSSVGSEESNRSGGGAKLAAGPQC